MLTRSPAPQAVRLSAIVVAGPASSAPSELRIFANPPVSDSPPITTRTEARVRLRAGLPLRATLMPAAAHAVPAGAARL